jgi:hypothetical protein
VDWGLDAPTNVSATDGGIGTNEAYVRKVHITWSASPGATGYRIYRAAQDDPYTITQVGDVSSSPLDDTTMEIAKDYYYWVKAYNTNRESANSNSDEGWATSHYCWGTRINNSATNTGVKGKHSLYTNYNVPNNHAKLFAPTTRGPHYCSLEVGSGYDNSGTYIYAFDFNNGAWYTRSRDQLNSYLDGNYYEFKTEYVNLQWHAKILRLDGLWEEIRVESPDQNSDGNGWDMFEEYAFVESPWPSLNRVFESDQLQVNENNWENCISPYGQYQFTIFGNANYSMQYVNQFWHWLVQD